MAPRYFISKDFGATDGLVSLSPHWVLAFARYANPVTFDPTRSNGGGSSTDDVSFAYKEKKVLVVDDFGDCVNVTVNAVKTSHTMQLQATLLDSGTKYLNEVLPGDWVIAFMVYSENELRELSGALRARNKVNSWNSGFKFLGRVSSIQKSVNVAPNGVRTSAYSLSCVAFAELDSTIMYYPEMSMSDNGALASQKRFGEQVSDLVRGRNSDEMGAIDPNQLIPVLMSVIFGKGAWADQKFRDISLTPNQAYIVPETVCKWLGVGSDKGKFSDIMRVMVGVQKYSSGAYATNEGDDPSSLFWPDGSKEETEGYSATFPLTGSFPVESVPQTTTSPWAFITNYVAAPVNEAMVTLRSVLGGDIVPVLTVRQCPYTSEVGKLFDPKVYQIEQELPSDKRGIKTVSAGDFMTLENDSSAGVNSEFRNRPTTRFLELPRWVIPDEILNESSFGRSDALRQNLVFVHGTGPGAPMNDFDQFVNAGPVVDKLDILRNGIRPYMPSVNCFLRDLVMLPTFWRAIMADIVMGQHLTLSGSLTVTGIRSPIAPGDNVEFQGVVYHIESVAHSCSISADGQRSFITRLTLSRGMVDMNPQGSNTDLLNRQRVSSFPNTHAADPEGPPVGVNMDV